MTKKNQILLTLLSLLSSSFLFMGCPAPDSVATCPAIENVSVTAVNMQAEQDTSVYRAIMRTSWTPVPNISTYQYWVVTTDSTTHTLINMQVTGTELDSSLVLLNPSVTIFSVAPIQPDGTVCPATTKRLAIPNSGIVIIDVGAGVYQNLPPEPNIYSFSPLGVANWNNTNFPDMKAKLASMIESNPTPNQIQVWLNINRNGAVSRYQLYDTGCVAMGTSTQWTMVQGYFTQNNTNFVKEVRDRVSPVPAANEKVVLGTSYDVTY